MGGGPLVVAIERRAHALLSLPERNGEPLQVKRLKYRIVGGRVRCVTSCLHHCCCQVLRYEAGQKYAAHHDFYNPEAEFLQEQPGVWHTTCRHYRQPIQLS